MYNDRIGETMCLTEREAVYYSVHSHSMFPVVRFVIARMIPFQHLLVSRSQFLLRWRRHCFLHTFIKHRHIYIVFLRFITFLPLNKVTLLAPEAEMATPNAAATASESLVPADCRPSAVLKSLRRARFFIAQVYLFTAIINPNYHRMNLLFLIRFYLLYLYLLW